MCPYEIFSTVIASNYHNLDDYIVVIMYQNLHFNFFPPFSMASGREPNLERFQKEGHSAFVVGYTGETGKALVTELNETKAFKRVVLIGRRQTNITEKLGEGFVRK